MTCFWDGVMTGLVHNRLMDNRMTPADFATHLKRHNCRTDGVTWCSGNAAPERLIQKTLEENEQWIAEYDVGTVSNGLDCGVLNPFLMLVCYLYEVDISHSFQAPTFDPVTRRNIGHTSSMSSYYRSDNSCTTRRMRFSSTVGHFVFKG